MIVILYTHVLLVEYLWVDVDGIAHTGPSTTPENSYEVYTTPDPSPPTTATITTASAAQAFGVLGRAGMLSSLNMQQKQFIYGMNQKPLRKLAFLTFSPAIDISVLRQVSYTLEYYAYILYYIVISIITTLH